MDKALLLSKLGNVLQVDPGALTEDFVLNGDNWDSAALLSAIAVIDEICSIVVPTNELKACGTVRELLAAVERNLAAV
jgi:acyl carrier protein